MFELIRFSAQYGEELVQTFDTRESAREYAVMMDWDGDARMTYGEEGALIRCEGCEDEIL